MNDEPTRGSTTASGERPPATPTWVKVLGITIAVALLILVLGMLLIGGEHGPGRHGS